MRNHRLRRKFAGSGYGNTTTMVIEESGRRVRTHRKMRFAAHITIAVLLAGSAVLAGCQRLHDAARPTSRVGAPNWPMYQFFANHNAVFSQAKFRASWTATLGDRVNGGLAVVHGVVYAASFDRRIYAIDAANGKILWAARTPNIVMSTPVVASGLVIIGTGHNGFLRPSDYRSSTWGREEGDDIIALDQVTGERVWSFHTIGEDMPSAAIANDSVIFANGDLHAYALNLRTGRPIWIRTLPGIVSMASMTINGSLGITSTCRNAPRRCFTIALDTRDGRELWSSPEGGSDASVTVNDGIAFVAGSYTASKTFRPGGRNIIAAIDEQTGKTIWRDESSDGPFSMVASDEHEITGTLVSGVYYVSMNNSDLMTAYDERHGNTLWTIRTVAPVKMSPVVVGDHVYFGDIAGILYNVKRASGKIITTSAMKSPFSTSPFVVVGQTLFLANGRNIAAVPLDQLQPST